MNILPYVSCYNFIILLFYQKAEIQYSKLNATKYISLNVQNIQQLVIFPHTIHTHTRNDAFVL